MQALERLDELERRMRDLIVALDGGRANTEAIERAWSLCQEHGHALPGLLEARRLLAEPERRSVDERLQRIASLNAVALQSAHAEHGQTRLDLEHLAQARAMLASAPAGESGESCDVSG